MADFWPRTPNGRRLLLCAGFATLAGAMSEQLLSDPDDCVRLSNLHFSLLVLWAGLTYGAAASWFAILGDITMDLVRRDVVQHVKVSWLSSLTWLGGLFVLHIGGMEFAVRFWGVKPVEPRWLGWFANLFNG